jgi:tripartite-type tricarboxylate transporter receptor subunit TctC
MKQVLSLRSLAGIAVIVSCSVALAAWPERVIQYVIAFPPGGESDVAARLQAETLKAKFGKEMIVVNKPGAGGGLAWSQMNTTPGDGYTITGINLPHIVLQPLEAGTNFKTEDANPVYWFHYTPDAVIVASDSPFKTLDDLIRTAKEKPEAVTFAGSGTNTANHAAWARFDRDFAVKTTYVPFKGTGDLVSSVLGGHVAAAMSYSTLAIQQKGKMRMLAVASDRRLPQFPDVPTFRELGVDWVDGAYRGIGVPKSTSPELRKQISDLIDQINKEPDTRKRMYDLGFEVTDITYDQMPEFMKKRSAEYMSSAKLLGLAK